nr:hypothetical protein [Solanum melongena]WMB96737.1 hypothetical protein [Solanum melongena]WMB96908.1 hypothetical protein [Solanum melongena]WMB97098.1 hypothetical protein [Solanum aethiopicum]
MLMTEMYQIAMEKMIPTVRPFFDIYSLFLIAVFRKILERVDKEFKYPCRCIFTSHSFGRSLSPVHLRRKSARSVSYYALFQGWLLLGKPPGCLCTPTSFITERSFRGLSW